MGEGGGDEVVFVENSSVLNGVFKFKEESILHKLRLQERLLVNRAVEEALETNVPEEVGHILFAEEILCE